MENYGFVKVAAATPDIKVADCDFNTTQIIRTIEEAEKQNVSIIVFPEMSITAYTVQDLFMQQTLLDNAMDSLNDICQKLSGLDIITIVGLPLIIENKLYNVAVVISDGKILGVVPKTFLPNYNEFYEERWFTSARELRAKTVKVCGQIVPVGTDLLFQTPYTCFAIEICEDLWTPIPPSSVHALHGAELIFNLSASNETTGKHEYRKSLVSQQSARLISGYIYASAGTGESTTDLVFSGCSMIAENGQIISESKRFLLEGEFIVSDIDVDKLKFDRLKNKSYTTTEYDNIGCPEYRIIDIDLTKKKVRKVNLQRWINPTPFVPSPLVLNERCDEIFSIQVTGLAKRLLHTGIKSSVIGVSGGLDSTLALLVLVKTYDKLHIPRENIVGITMPGFGTTSRTYNNSLLLMEALGVTSVEISIVNAVNQHFKDIDHDPSVHDITYENSQARERTQILMDYANKTNGMVIGTGDLSELALGWCTYNGDHMSMYAVNSGIPKTLVKTLVSWVSDTQIDDKSRDILKDILDTPVSPELLPASDSDEILQKTEETVGPYILHDFFLFYMVRYGFSPKKIYFLAKVAFLDKYDNETILKWLKVFFRRFFTQQFKRSCMPDGPKVGSINLSPRGDWRMPSDASYAIWQKELDTIQ